MYRNAMAIACILLLQTTAGLAQNPQGELYQVRMSRVNPGGGNSSSASYSLSGNLQYNQTGQRSASSDYVITPRIRQPNRAGVTSWIQYF